VNHLSLDALADLLAGEGGEADVAHLAGCAGCSGRLDELAAAEVEVAAVLASLPAPPVPDGLAARLQSAFDAEPALVPAAAAEGAALATQEHTLRAGGATVTPFPAAGSGRRRSRLPAAAAVAVLVSGGVLGAALLSGGVGGVDESTTSAADEAGGSAEADPFGDLTRNETGNDYVADGTLAAALPSLLGGSATPLTGALSPPSAQESAERSADEPAPAAAPAEPVPAPSGPVAAARDSAEAPTAQEGTSDFGLTAAGPELDRLRTAEGLASCLLALLPPDDDTVRPLAVDYAAYSGQPALVVLLPGSGAPDKVDVFVVGAGCAQPDASLLFFAQLDRPA
jgi:hypothetical protein